MRNTIYTSFNEPKLAERAAGALLDYGVRPEDLTVIQSHATPQPVVEYSSTQPPKTAVYVVPNPLGAVSGLEALGQGSVQSAVYLDEQKPKVEVFHRELENAAKEGISTTTPEDAGAGAVKGTAWGVGIGIAAVLATMFVPGVGLVIGGGALASAIGAFAATTGAGAAVGAVTGFLKDQGVEAHVAEVYETAIRSGGAILALTVPSGNIDESKAWEILDKYAAINVTSYPSSSSYLL